MRRFNAGRFFSGLLLATIGFGIRGHWIVIVIGVIGLIMMIGCMDDLYFCADCGNCRGADPSGPCPRCGCNIYSKEYTGSGRTFRNR